MADAKPKSKKHCTNVACALRDTQVETDAEVCVMCGKPLQSSVADTLKRLFGEDNANPFAEIGRAHV